MREALSLVIIKRITDRGATVRAYDPVAISEAPRGTRGWRGIEFATSGPAATQGADALVIATKWEEFRSPAFSALCSDLKQPSMRRGRPSRSRASAVVLRRLKMGLGERTVFIFQASQIFETSALSDTSVHQRTTNTHRTVGHVCGFPDDAVHITGVAQNQAQHFV